MFYSSIQILQAVQQVKVNLYGFTLDNALAVLSYHASGHEHGIGSISIHEVKKRKHHICLSKTKKPLSSTKSSI